MKGLHLRLGVSIFVLFLGLAYALPSLPFLSALNPYLPDAHINLGLDLKGGMHLLLEVQVDKAVASGLNQVGQEVRQLSEEDGITVLRQKMTDDGKLEILLPIVAQEEALRKLIATRFAEIQIIDTISAGDSGGLRVIFDFTSEAKASYENMAVDQVVRTIRNRIDQFGVAEPDIRKQADNTIQVQLPGMTDPERAIALVGQTAHLAFHIVRDDVDPKSPTLPEGTSLFMMTEKSPAGNEIQIPIVLDTVPLMTGENISDSRPNFDEKGSTYVGLNFNNTGAATFERITGENKGKRLAIVLDGNVYSAPVIQDRIAGGRASITGKYTVQEATDLAIVLRAGALPAPVVVIEERTVGPTLGQESITKGIRAAIIGALAVVVIMPIYYGLSGVIAVIMLCFTMLLVMAGLAGFGASLTLPGIAGIVLTIGMSVDANVLIFERIREELRLGRTINEAVGSGFSRATISIIDSNLTTIIAAAILYQFGTGPIKGFAITLSLGIIASMFTAVFVSKDLYYLWMQSNTGKKISI